MSETMLERLVLAYLKARHGENYPWISEEYEHAEEMVRAILEAMREPSEAMLDAVTKTVAATGDLTEEQRAVWLEECRRTESSSRWEAKSQWKAMLNTILESK